MIADLQRRLDSVADPDTKTWFENYLKHVIGCSGVKTPMVARIVAEWRSECGVERLTDDDQLAVVDKRLVQRAGAGSSDLPRRDRGGRTDRRMAHRR